jgi:hypothetical protein
MCPAPATTTSSCTCAPTAIIAPTRPLLASNLLLPLLLLHIPQPVCRILLLLLLMDLLRHLLLLLAALAFLGGQLLLDANACQPVVLDPQCPLLLECSPLLLALKALRRPCLVCRELLALARLVCGPLLGSLGWLARAPTMLLLLLQGLGGQPASSAVTSGQQ